MFPYVTPFENPQYFGWKLTFLHTIYSKDAVIALSQRYCLTAPPCLGFAIATKILTQNTINAFSNQNDLTFGAC